MVFWRLPVYAGRRYFFTKYDSLRELHRVANASCSVSSNGCKASNMSYIGLSQAFDVTSGDVKVSMGQQRGPPGVAYGALWSNSINTLWLYNGRSIWRFDTESQTWAIHESSGIDQGAMIRTGGSSLTVPSKAKGYYLGGYTEGNESLTKYYHTLVIFDMEDESLKSQPIPDEVPIVAPALVYLDAGDAGLLAVMGGKVEKDGVLAYAGCP